MEYLDIIDDKNEVIGKAAKPDIYAKKLPHRIVHVWLMNAHGEMAMALRAPTVSYKPLHWCSTAAGHVRSDESFLEAGVRELEEECEIKTDLVLKENAWYEGADAPGLRKILGLCEGNYETAITAHNREVAEVRFFPIKEIHQMIARGELMHPEFVFLFQKRSQ